MEYGNVPGVDKPISRLVQGTTMLDAKRPEWTFDLLDEVFAAGGTTFDTAQSYMMHYPGDIEHILGKWINSRGIRDKVVIVGKGCHPSSYRKRVTPHDIASDIADSLARLETDYIDLFLLHRDTPVLPVAPLIDALNEHYNAGRIRAFGASNWTIERLVEANAYAEANGLKGFIASSPNFSLAEQFAEPWPDCITISGPQNAAARAWYLEHNMPLFTWSSLAGGFFSGRFRRDNLDTFTNYWDTVVIPAYCHEPNFQRLDRVEQLGAELGLTSAQVAIAYVMNQPLNIFAVMGTQSGAEFRANAAAAQVKLPPETIAWLDLASDTR